MSHHHGDEEQIRSPWLVLIGCSCQNYQAVSARVCACVRERQQEKEREQEGGRRKKDKDMIKKQKKTENDRMTFQFDKRKRVHHLPLLPVITILCLIEQYVDEM